MKKSRLIAFMSRYTTSVFGEVQFDQPGDWKVEVYSPEAATYTYIIRVVN